MEGCPIIDCMQDEEERELRMELLGHKADKSRGQSTTGEVYYHC